MKKTRKAFSVLLCLLLLCAALLPAVSAAETEIRFFYACPDDFDMPSVPEGIDEDVDWDGVKAALEAGIRAHEESIDLSAFAVDADNEANMDYISEIIFRSPSLLYNSSGISYSMSGSGMLRSIWNQYLYTGQEFAVMSAECEDAVTQLLYGIRGNTALSEAECCLLVHDRLAQWCEYDYANFQAETVPHESYSAYGALVNHRSVCQGYAYAFEWLMDELGIPCVYISSESINHGWNMVTLDGEDYFIDVTWDDPVWDIPGYVEHVDLLKPFASFSASHRNAKDFTDSPSSDLYENEYWADLNCEIVYADGAFWYLTPAEGTPYYAATHLDLVKRLSDGTETVMKTIESVWDTGRGSVLSCDSAALTAIGDELLYSSVDAIYSYNVKTGEEKTVFEPDMTGYAAGNHIFGFTQLDGTLYATVSTSVKFDGNTKRDNTQSFAYCTEHENRELLQTLTPAVSGAAGSGKFICKDCRAIFIDEITLCTHSFGAWTTDSAATCEEGGSEKRECALCGLTETRETAKDPANHTGVTVCLNAVAATCSRPGYSGDTHCFGCGAKLAEGKTIPADASKHVYKAVKVAAATCTANGNIAYYVCENAGCGKTFTLAGHICTEVQRDAVVVPASGHAYEISSVEAPGCVTDGFTVYQCSVCRAFCQSDPVPAAGHRDANADGNCDSCGENMAQATCRHLCHKSGLPGLLWKIINLFCRMFKVDRYCECGEAHW